MPPSVAIHLLSSQKYILYLFGTTHVKLKQEKKILIKIETDRKIQCVSLNLLSTARSRFLVFSYRQQIKFYGNNDIDS